MYVCGSWLRKIATFFFPHFPLCIYNPLLLFARFLQKLKKKKDTIDTKTVELI